MKDFRKEIWFGAGLVVFLVALVYWLTRGGPQPVLTIVIAVLTSLIGIYAFSRLAINRKRLRESSEPPEDEFTKLAKVYAGNQAFQVSLYFWLVLFIFNSNFTKNETLLGVGILGSAVIYGVSLWYFQRTGEFNEK